MTLLTVTLLTVRVFWSKFGSPFTENLRIECHLLTVTLSLVPRVKGVTKRTDLNLFPFQMEIYCTTEKCLYLGAYFPLRKYFYVLQPFSKDKFIGLLCRSFDNL